MIKSKKHIDHLVQCILEGPEDWEEYYGKPYQPIAYGWTPDELGSALVFLLRTSYESLLKYGLPESTIPMFVYDEYRYEPPDRRLETLEFLRALQGFRIEAESSPHWDDDNELAHDVVEEYIQWITQTLLDYYTGGEYTRTYLFYNE
jgi:hypothetical protein